MQWRHSHSTHTSRYLGGSKHSKHARHETCFTPGSSKSLLTPGVWRATMMTCGMKLPKRFRNPKAWGRRTQASGEREKTVRVVSTCGIRLLAARLFEHNHAIMRTQILPIKPHDSLPEGGGRRARDLVTCMLILRRHNRGLRVGEGRGRSGRRA